MDPDQDRRSVGPDLGPNCLQKQKSPLAEEELMVLIACLAYMTQGYFLRFANYGMNVSFRALTLAATRKNYHDSYAKSQYSDQPARCAG